MRRTTTYNWMGGKHPLTQDLCAVSLILSKRGDHAYILIESLNERNEVSAFEGHLGAPDDKRAVVETINTTLDRLKDIAANNKARTWGISRDEMQRLKENIIADEVFFRENEVRYVKIGEAKGAGMFGASLDTIGSTRLKQTSTASNDSLVDKEFGSLRGSAHSLHDSVDASLRRGPNCASWAKGRVQEILGDRYQETVWERMAECVVVAPGQVVTPGACLVS